MSYPDPYEAYMETRWESQAIYHGVCPVTQKQHDWRHATDAPGRRYGDECVRCERCQMKAIAPAAGKEEGNATR